MTGSVVAAGKLELTFTFHFTRRAGPLMICIWSILCWGLLTFTFVNATVPLFLLCGLKEKQIRKYQITWAGWRGRGEIWMSRVRVVLIFSFNSRGGVFDVLNYNVEDTETLFTQNMHFTQQSKIEFLLFPILHKWKAESVKEGQVHLKPTAYLLLLKGWNGKGKQILYNCLYFFYFSFWLHKK